MQLPPTTKILRKQFLFFSSNRHRFAVGEALNKLLKYPVPEFLLFLTHMAVAGRGRVVVKCLMLKAGQSRCSGNSRPLPHSP